MPPLNKNSRRQARRCGTASDRHSNHGGCSLVLEAFVLMEVLIQMFDSIGIIYNSLELMVLAGEDAGVEQQW